MFTGMFKLTNILRNCRFFDKYEPPLIYGRRGLPQKNEGEGFAICKV